VSCEDRTGSGSCPVADFGIGSVEISDSIARVFVCLFVSYSVSRLVGWLVTLSRLVG
jgi:hypothetical protein